MFAGGAPPRAAGCGGAPWPRAAPGGAPAPLVPRAGGGPSGTTTALVIVASVSVRLFRLSQGTDDAVTARSRNALPIMVPPRANTRRIRRRAFTLSHTPSPIHSREECDERPCPCEARRLGAVEIQLAIEFPRLRTICNPQWTTIEPT